MSWEFEFRVASPELQERAFLAIERTDCTEGSKGVNHKGHEIARRTFGREYQEKLLTAEGAEGFAECAEKSS